MSLCSSSQQEFWPGEGDAEAPKDHTWLIMSSLSAQGTQSLGEDTAGSVGSVILQGQRAAARSQDGLLLLLADSRSFGLIAL